MSPKGSGRRNVVVGTGERATLTVDDMVWRASSGAGVAHGDWAGPLPALSMVNFRCLRNDEILMSLNWELAGASLATSFHGTFPAHTIKVLARGGSGLVPSGSSGTDQTERELRNLNGAGADPTEQELGSLNGARADPTEQELRNWNGAGADPTEQELGNLNGARADSTEHELGNLNLGFCRGGELGHKSWDLVKSREGELGHTSWDLAERVNSGTNPGIWLRG
ncbi:hypothetical protein B296_00046472 [Ensete ventricosum]|uniref:Uncharacterized protein n=1 Tax=Ensete ventricosum TaxID=4639 RepID=A0A426XD32_ENSVE|nr:hypothetical protein B296_00046472 [Ensete ventricosum]